MKNTNNESVTIVKAKKLYHFEDGDFEIPSKIKCPKCGKMVMGYPPLVKERVYKFYGGSWLRYQKEWVCSECKREASAGIKAELEKGKKEDQIKKAIELLESEGYKVEKK